MEYTAKMVHSKYVDRAAYRKKQQQRSKKMIQRETNDRIVFDSRRIKKKAIATVSSIETVFFTSPKSLKSHKQQPKHFALPHVSPHVP